MQGKVAREFEGWVYVRKLTLRQKNVLTPPPPPPQPSAVGRGQGEVYPPNYQYLALFACASAAGRWKCLGGCITVHV
jgi:hypothetical protein